MTIILGDKNTASRKPTKIFKIKDYPLFLPKGMQYIALVGKKIVRGGALAAQFSGRSQASYCLRAPHNATSVIGDPAEFRGKDYSRASREN